MEETEGELKVSLKEVELNEQDLIHLDMESGSYVCLTIADTGVGMEKDVMAKIFDPFFTTKAKGKGTGLGLSIVHGIIKNMCGGIQVSSEPDKGTVFNIYIKTGKKISQKTKKIS